MDTKNNTADISGNNTGISGNITIKDSEAKITNTNTTMTECLGIQANSLVIDNSQVIINQSGNGVVGTQIGGTSGTANSTGIELTFSEEITGLTADKVTITKGTGEVTKGNSLTGAGKVWTISLDSVITEGNVTVSVLDFGEYKVTTTTQTVAVYKVAGGGSSGGGDYYTPIPPTTTTPEKKPDQPITETVTVIATAKNNGAASASIPDNAITDAITKAQEETANSTTVELNITMPKGATSLTVTLTQNSLNSLVNAEVSRLELAGMPVSLGLDLNALKEILKQSGDNININITPATELSDEAKALLGDRPVYNITISYLKNDKTTDITSLGNGTAVLSIPYTLGKNEAVGYLFGVYIDANGKVQRINGSAYDANSGSLLIPTNHFSVYGVGYTAPSAKFTDISTHWGKEAIDYIVGRGLLLGTSETTFTPNTAMTRGMLVTALGRLAEVDVKAYTESSFTDVKTDSAFRPYIEWAYKKAIVNGIGNQQFAPNRPITREEIAIIFANYAKATGYKLPVINEATTYADASNIGNPYKTAVTAMQQAGIMMGGTGNSFNPKSNATRAEISAMLYRYIKLTIDPATAWGWVKNDVGQHLYYKDSLMVSEKWLEIDSKWYYFYKDGTLAKNTKVDGYKIDENGIRKTE